MTKQEATRMACMYIWSMRNGYEDLYYLPYAPPEVREILYKNRRRLKKFFVQHIKKVRQSK